MITAVQVGMLAFGAALAALYVYGWYAGAIKGPKFLYQIRAYLRCPLRINGERVFWEATFWLGGISNVCHTVMELTLYASIPTYEWPVMSPVWGILGIWVIMISRSELVRVSVEGKRSEAEAERQTKST